MSKNRIVWDKKGLKHIDDALARSLGIAGHLLQGDIREAQVIPRMDGTLSGEAFKVDDSTAKQGYIRFTFSTPYARRLYFHPEYKFHKEPWTDASGKRHDGNPNAQGRWTELWMEGGIYEDRPSEILTKVIKWNL